MTVGPVAKLYCVTKQRQNRSLRSWVAAEYPRRTVCVITVTCVHISVLFSQCASRNVREHISVNVCFSIMKSLVAIVAACMPHTMKAGSARAVFIPRMLRKHDSRITSENMRH